MNKALLPTLLAALAVPATASAGTIGGNPAQGSPAKLVNCTGDTGAVQPCSITVTKVDGTPAVVPGGSTITGFSGYFDTDSYVRVRVMRNNGNGTVTSVDSSAGYVTDGGVNDFSVNVPVPAGGQHFVALDLMEGSVAADPDTDSQFFAADKVFDDDETGSGGDPAAYKLAMNVTYEKQGTTPPELGGGGNGGGNDGGNDGGQSEAVFSMNGQGILGHEPGKPYVKIFSRTEGDESVAVDMQLKVGKKVVATRSEDEMEYHSSDTWFLTIPSKVGKTLLKKGKLTATATAKVKGLDSGRTRTYSQKVKILRGGDARYDGTYRGDGPVVLVVKRGVVVNVSQSMFLFCSASGDNMTRAMQPVSDQMPALVARNGSFSAKGSSGYDTFTYKGKLSRTGTSKGYSSLFHTNVYYGSSGMTSEECYQASNWTAKRA